jgi:hypothetical protein
MDDDAIQRLVDEAGFIFRGSLHHHPAGAPPAVPPELGEAIGMRIEHVLRSAPALGGLAGQEAQVITRNAGPLRQCQHPILFTAVVSLGQQLLLREIGHAETSAEAARQVAAAIAVAEERPFRQRVAAADLIVTATVVDSHVLDPDHRPKGEHDPLWWLARLAVQTVHKGRKPRGEIEVLFAASIDRAWARSPKLHAGTTGLLLLHPVPADERPGLAPRNAYQVTHPLDLLPADRLARVEAALGGETGGR